jgi:serine/threonine protein kinase
MDHILALQNLGFGVLEEMMASTCKNYKVEQNGKYFTAKVAERSEKESYFQVIKEYSSLCRLAIIPNTARLCDLYYGESEYLMVPKSAFSQTNVNPDLAIIIKDFIPGETIEDKKLDLAQKIILSKTVLKIHEKGICNLDLRPNNVVVSNLNNQPYLFDFGMCVYREFMDAITFRGLVRQDLANLEKL